MCSRVRSRWRVDNIFIRRCLPLSLFSSSPASLLSLSSPLCTSVCSSSLRVSFPQRRFSTSPDHQSISHTQSATISADATLEQDTDCVSLQEVTQQEERNLVSPPEENKLEQEVEKIALEKLEVLRAGVKNGDLECIAELADCFRKGRFGIPKDPKVAVEWYKRAAMKGHSAAQYNLALCYFTGTGVEIDDDKCSLLLHEASRNGHIKAKAHLSQHCLKGIGGTKEDTGKGIELMRECAVAGHRPSQLNLANLYFHGTFGVEKNYKQAAIWFKKAAGSGDAMAARMLGHMFEKGLGEERDSNIALQWYTTAAKAGDAPSQFTLAAIFEFGTDDVVADRVTSDFWLDQAVAQGFQPAIDFKKSQEL